LPPKKNPTVLRNLGKGGEPSPLPSQHQLEMCLRRPKKHRPAT
jgi:hypothetical protein